MTITQRLSTRFLVMMYLRRSCHVRVPCDATGMRLQHKKSINVFLTRDVVR